MTTSSLTALISSKALARRIGEPHLRILDASWHMPTENRNARKEYDAAHISHAQFFDIDEISDRGTPYPHMLPSVDDFAKAVSALGISNDNEVVIYDSSGLFSAARAWWMFRVMGHDNVRVLDGGLPRWKEEKRELESGAVTATQVTFKATLKPQLLRTAKQIETNIISKDELVLDARSHGRFSGQEPEPRPGLKSGHIEGSKNLFFKDVLNPPSLKSREELASLYAARGIDIKERIIASCGSGVTACILALALFELGNENVAIYDGAWAEWGSR